MSVVGLKGWEREGTATSTLTTGASYSDANTVTWRCPLLSEKTIIISNEGDTNSLTWRVRLRTSVGGVQYTFDEDVLAKSSKKMIVLNNSYEEVEIAVKNGGGSTTAIIEYGGRLLG